MPDRTHSLHFVSSFRDTQTAPDIKEPEDAPDASTGIHPCDVLKWHHDLDDPQTCSNGPYPVMWNAFRHTDMYLFDSAEECCELRYPGVKCAIVNKCKGSDAGDPPTPEESEQEEVFYRLGQDEVLSEIPWDFGSPAQWRIDEDVSVSEEDAHLLEWDAFWLGTTSHNSELLSFTNYSITNIPVEDEGASSNVTLRIHVPDKATLRCLALVDVHMPFDKFKFVVNGYSRHEYHDTRITDGWTEIKTGFRPGNNTIVFSVENGLYIPNIERFAGSGRVWLDQCQIVSHE